MANQYCSLPQALKRYKDYISRYCDVVRRTLLNGNIKAISDDLGVPESTVYKWGDPESRNNLKVIDLPALVQSTGNTEIVEFICRECGGYFIPEPEDRTTVDDRASLLSAVSKIHTDAASLVQDGIGIAQGNGKGITPEQRAALNQKAHTLVKSAFGLLTMLALSAGVQSAATVVAGRLVL